MVSFEDNKTERIEKIGNKNFMHYYIQINDKEDATICTAITPYQYKLLKDK